MMMIEFLISHLEKKWSVDVFVLIDMNTRPSIFIHCYGVANTFAFSNSQTVNKMEMNYFD